MPWLVLAIAYLIVGAYLAYGCEFRDPQPLDKPLVALLWPFVVGHTMREVRAGRAHWKRRS